MYICVCVSVREKKSELRVFICVPIKTWPWNKHSAFLNQLSREREREIEPNNNSNNNNKQTQDQMVPREKNTK